MFVSDLFAGRAASWKTTITYKEELSNLVLEESRRDSPEFEPDPPGGRDGSWTELTSVRREKDFWVPDFLLWNDRHLEPSQ